jgi:hypothetical protein
MLENRSIAIIQQCYSPKNPSSTKMIAIVRGFKMDRAKFIEFFPTNGGPFVESYLMSRSDQDKISKLFVSLGCDCEVKVFLSWEEELEAPDYLFVCCQWQDVLNFVDLDNVFQDPVPGAFERLRDLLQPEATITRYAVHNSEVEWWMVLPRVCI